MKISYCIRKMRAVNKKEAKTVNLTEVFELGKQIMIKNNDNVNSFLSTPDELYFLFVWCIKLLHQ